MRKLLLVLLALALSLCWADVEPNDTYAAANPLTLGASQTGNLEDPDRNDWYAVTLPHAGALVVTLTPSSALQARVAIVDEDGAVELGFRITLTGGLDSVFRRDLQAGLYYIQVNRYNGQGAYTLETRFDDIDLTDIHEPNNTYQTAEALALNTTTTGQVGYVKNGVTDVHDWFAVTLPHAGALVVKVTPTAALQSRVAIIDEDGNSELNFQITPTGGLDSVFRRDLQAGLYYVRVDRYNGQGAYTLETRFDDIGLTDIHEPNNTYQTAEVLAPNTTTTGQVGYMKNSATDAHDWFAITLPNAGALVVSVTPTAGLQARVAIIDEDGSSELNFQITPTGGLDSVFRRDLQAGLYYVRVDRYNGQGAYTLETRFDDIDLTDIHEPNNTYQTAAVLTPNTTTTGQVGYVKNSATDAHDWFAVTLPHAGSLMASVSPTAALQSRIAIIDSDGSSELSFKITRTGEQDSVFRRDLQAGLYYIRVDRYNGYGAYTLNLHSPEPVQANFSAHRLSGTAPLVVNFTDSSTGEPTQWRWSFGDTQTSTQQNPTHTFSAPGTYSVQLWAGNTNSADSVIRTNYITVHEPFVVDTGWIPANIGNGNGVILAHAWDSLQWVALDHTGKTYTSADGGGTWAQKSTITIPSSAYMRRAAVTPSGLLIQVGDGGRIFTSADSGATWVVRTSGVTVALNALYFVNEQNGWIGGDDARVLRTADGGTTWAASTATGASHVNALHFFNEDEGVLLGHYGKMFRTENGGTTWSQTADFTFAFDDRRFAGLAELSPGELVAVGGVLPRAYHSADSGRTWALWDSVPGAPTYWSAQGVQGNLVVTGVLGQIWHRDAVSGGWASDSTGGAHRIAGVQYSGWCPIAWGDSGYVYRKRLPVIAPPATMFELVSAPADTGNDLRTDTLYFEFSKTVDEQSLCSGIEYASSNDRFAGYSCLTENTWLADSVTVAVRFSHYATLGQDTGSVVVDLSGVLAADGDTLEQFSIRLLWDLRQSSTALASAAVPSAAFRAQMRNRGEGLDMLVRLDRAQMLSPVIRDLSGRQIASMAPLAAPAGESAWTWQGLSLQPGVYTVSLGANTGLPPVILSVGQ